MRSVLTRERTAPLCATFAVRSARCGVRSAQCVEARSVYALGENVGGKRVVRDKLGRYAAERTTICVRRSRRGERVVDRRSVAACLRRSWMDVASKRSARTSEASASSETSSDATRLSAPPLCATLGNSVASHLVCDVHVARTAVEKTASESREAGDDEADLDGE